MASNGVILLNLNNRNAAEFQRLSVPDSYDKASGALTAGTYVTVYKWLYQGFMLAPSLCDAVDATDHINLVDRTNGGIISVYPDDTITVEGGVSPEPVLKRFRTYHVTSGSTTNPHTLTIQMGHYDGEYFDFHWNPDDIILDGEPITLTTSMATPYYLLAGCATISYISGWIVRSVQAAHEYSGALGEWVSFAENVQLEQWDRDSSSINKYYCEDSGSVITLTLEDTETFG